MVEGLILATPLAADADVVVVELAVTALAVIDQAALVIAGAAMLKVAA